MANSYSTTIYIYPFDIETELLYSHKRYNSKGLINFEQINISYSQTSLLTDLLDSTDWRSPCDPVTTIRALSSGR